MTSTHGVYCGCYYCLEHFLWEQTETFVDNGDTAVCPYCYVDSVIDSHKPIDGEYLKDLQERWFGRTIKLGDIDED